MRACLLGCCVSSVHLVRPRLGREREPRTAYTYIQTCIQARLQEDQRERGLSAAGKAALVHFSYKKPPPTPTSAAPTLAQPEAAAGGGGFDGEPDEEGEEPPAPTVSRQSSSCLSLAASTKQPSGLWTEEEQEDGAGGCCGLSEGAGKEGGASSGGSGVKDEGGVDEEEEEEEMGPKKERPSSPTAYFPTDALIDSSCSICLNEYEEGDSLTLLPICKHVFHDACISVWLARHVRCPLCQFDLSVLGSSGTEGAHLDRPPFGPSTASMTATPMAPRQAAGGWRPTYGDVEDDEQEELGRGGGNRRAIMTIVNEPAGRVGFGGERGDAQQPAMRIVAVDVGEEGQ